jgi:hypothetical protein
LVSADAGGFLGDIAAMLPMVLTALLINLPNRVLFDFPSTPKHQQTVSQYMSTESKSWMPTT